MDMGRFHFEAAMNKAAAHTAFIMFLWGDRTLRWRWVHTQKRSCWIIQRTSFPEWMHQSAFLPVT